MPQMTVRLTPDELDTVLIALNWYVDDREECASIEEWGLYDAGPEENRIAAKRASNLLKKLRHLL